MNRIEELRTKMGISKAEAARRLNMPYTTYIGYEKCEREPNSEILILLSNFFHVSVDYLIGRDDNGNIHYPTNIIPIPETIGIPLVGTIACGEPITAEENIEMFVRLDTNIAADFALRCKGDSMITSRIFDGDIVYIRQQPEVENGEIAAVLIGTEATLKKVYMYPNRLVLRPSNPMYEDMIYSGDELSSVQILGKAVAFTSLVRHSSENK